VENCKQTVLLTGVAGFIAAETARELLVEGVGVVGIDNLNDYYDVRLKHHRLEKLEKLGQQGNFHFYKGDIENKGDLLPLFEKYQFDSVLNLAARAGVRYSLQNPEVYMTTNALGTLNLLQLMHQFGTKKLVLASTSSLYAGQALPFDETLPVNTPISPYAASKKAAEVMAYSYHYLYGIDVSIVRYFTVYGPAGRPDMSIFRFIKWIDEATPITLYGDGKQSRDFTYVEDIAEGTVKARQKVGYEIVNLGGGKEPISLNQVIASIEDRLGKKAKIDHRKFHRADLMETWAKIDKAKELFGWAPKTTFEKGLELTIDWYLENRKLCSLICV